MKTRIISGAVMVALMIGVLLIWSVFTPASVIFVAILAAFAAYEALYKTGYNKNISAVLLAAVYSAFMPFVYCGYVNIPSAAVTVIFVVLMIAVCLKNHSQISAPVCGFSLALPIGMAYAFSSIAALLNSFDSNGLLYLLLLLNFSSIADCGAYFVGSAIGKHKLAPVLSPKKTVEGSVGGIICSVVFTFAIILIYNKVGGSVYGVNVWPFVAVTPVFAVLGMMGDIFFSYIKRQCGIKDYSNLIPGHGGILDRFDSILMIAPVFVIFLQILLRF